MLPAMNRRMLEQLDEQRDVGPDAEDRIADGGRRAPGRGQLRAFRRSRSASPARDRSGHRPRILRSRRHRFGCRASTVRGRAAACPACGRSCRAGSSAYTRSSMACPRWERSLCVHASGSSGRDRDLRANEVDAGHLLGHRMLDLQPRVHLEEVEPRGIAGPFHEELHGPRVAISRLARDSDRRFTHALPQRRSDRRRRTLLDHFLVAALNRALALEQVDDVAVMIGEDLELDVARLLDQPFNVERAVAKRGHRFASCLRDCRDEIVARRAPSSSRCRRHLLMA